MFRDVTHSNSDTSTFSTQLIQSPKTLLDTKNFKISDLPIASRLEEIVDTVRNNNVVIIKAETGSGKSTIVGKALTEAGFKTVVTQPRILAARSLAEWVSELVDGNLGGYVGYRSSLERCDSPLTRLLYVTDGLQLVRELFGNAGKRDILVLDEVHEWNLNMEVLNAWARSRQKKGADFKLVIMSATIDTENLSTYLGFGKPTPVIEVDGRLFSVEHQPRGKSIEEDTLRLLREGRNVLVFQPGKTEIKKTIEALRLSKVNAEILPLHADMSPYEQQLCYKKYEKPICIVATNVAQTSITIPNIDAVVDSGLERRFEVVDGKERIESLMVSAISKADSKQREGRAGRTHEGIYIDHCPVSWDNRPDYPVPEIKRVNLGQVYLRLKKANLNMEELEFFHNVDSESLKTTQENLRKLGCLDYDGCITEIGKKIAHLPVSEQAGRMMIEAERRGVLKYFPSIIAAYEKQGIQLSTTKKWKKLCSDEQDSDLVAQYNLIRVAETFKTDREFKDAGLSKRDYEQVVAVEAKLKDILGIKSAEPLPKTIPDKDKLGVLKAIGSGLIEHIWLHKDKNCFTRKKDEEPRILSDESVVEGKSLVVGRALDLGSNLWSSEPMKLVVWASKIELSWINEIAPDLRRRESSSIVSSFKQVNRDEIPKRIRKRDPRKGKRIGVGYQ